MRSRGNAHLAVALDWIFGQAREQAKRLGARIVDFIDARADAYAAAALYAELSKLSNAELERRGMARGDLHRCVFEALDGSAVASAASGDATK